MEKQMAISIKRNIVSFVYHRFGESRYPSTNIDVQVFEQQLQHLKSGGYEVMTLGAALKDTSKAEQPIVVLTIDDAFASVLDMGMPLLRKYGFKATLFVNTATVGSSGYLTWDQLRALKKEGIEIGHHSHGHDFFLDVPKAQREAVFQADITTANGHFERELGEIPDFFAYPYGEYDIALQAQVKAAGFKAAMAQQSGGISASSQLYALPRFPMGGAFAHLKGFKEKVKMRDLRILQDASQLPVTVINGTRAPGLSLTITEEDLEVDQLQCFIAGLPLDRSQITVQRVGTQTRIQILPYPLSQRRTLCTVTVPDKSGKWHWFSHLWIRPDIKG